MHVICRSLHTLCSPMLLLLKQLLISILNGIPLIRLLMSILVLLLCLLFLLVLINTITVSILIHVCSLRVTALLKKLILILFNGVLIVHDWICQIIRILSWRSEMLFLRWSHDSSIVWSWITTANYILEYFQTINIVITYNIKNSRLIIF